MRPRSLLKAAVIALAAALVVGCEAKAPHSSSGTVRHGPNLGLLLDRARDFVAKGRTSEAVKVYETILRAEPDHITSLYELAVLDRRLGHPEGSVLLLERLLTGRGLPVRANLLFASIRSAPNGLPADPVAAKVSLEEAARHARAAVAANPVDPGTHASLGRILALSGRPGEAEKELLRALDLNAGDVDSALWLAIVRARRGEPPVAAGKEPTKRLAGLSQWIRYGNRPVTLPCPPTAGGALLVVRGEEGRDTSVYVGDLDGPVRVLRSGPRGFEPATAIPGTGGAVRLARTFGGVLVVRRKGPRLVIDRSGRVRPFTGSLPHLVRRDALDIDLPFAAEVIFGASAAAPIEDKDFSGPGLILAGDGLTSSTPRRPRLVSAGRPGHRPHR